MLLILMILAVCFEIRISVMMTSMGPVVFGVTLLLCGNDIFRAIERIYDAFVLSRSEYDYTEVYYNSVDYSWAFHIGTISRRGIVRYNYIDYKTNDYKEYKRFLWNGLDLKGRGDKRLVLFVLKDRSKHFAYAARDISGLLYNNRSSLLMDFSNVFITSMKDKLNIDVADATVLKRTDSYFAADNGKRVPCLKIMTKGNSYERLIGHPERMGLIDDSLREKVLEIYRESLDENDLEYSDYYDSMMYIEVSRYEKICYSDYAYNHKDEVEHYLKILIGKTPKSIYASSVPGLNIVYETEDYLSLKLEDRKDEIQGKIRNMADAFVEGKYGPGIKMDFKVTFWHPQMPGYNGYGLTRQD